MRDVDVRPAAIEGDAAALYVGDVMHARLKPVGHRFSYRVMSLLIDLDRLEVADRHTPLFRVNRRPGRLIVAALCRALRSRTRYRSDRRAGTAAVLSSLVRLHLQSAFGLLLLHTGRRACPPHL